MSEVVFTVREHVRYAETDQMGIAYYATYPVWFEVGRTRLMAARGLPYREVEARGYLLPVSETYFRLLAPARYEDAIDIDTWIARVESRRVTFGYRVRRGDTRLAEGWTRLVCLDTDFRPRRFPPWLVDAMGPATGDVPAGGTRRI
jgi:acyl-CoA thioester hydrolase